MNLNPERTLESLLLGLADNSRIEGGSSTRLQRALNDSNALTSLNTSLTNTLAFQRELAREQARAQAEAQRAQAAEFQRRQQVVSGLISRADARFLPQVDSEERNQFRGTEFEALWRRQVLQDQLEQASAGNLDSEESIQRLNDLQLAVQTVEAQDAQRGFTPEVLQEYGQAINFAEAYGNRDQSAFNPVSFVRNAAAGAIRGAAGLADLGVTALSGGVLGSLGQLISQGGEAAGEFADDTSLGTTLQQELLARRDSEGFVEGARDFLETSNAGSVVDQIANLGGLIGAGGPITSGVRAGARAAGIGQRAGAAQTLGQALQRGGGGAVAAGAGQDFAGSAVDPDGLGGDRFQQAATQLGLTGLLAGAGGSATLGGLVGGIEAAAAQRNLLGGALRPRSAVVPPRTTTVRGDVSTTSGPGLLGGLALDGADRALAAGQGAITRGASETGQEILEELISQAGRTVGTNQNQFEAAGLGQAGAAGALLGGATGAARGAQFRPANTPASTPAEAVPGAAPAVAQPDFTGPPAPNPAALANVGEIRAAAAQQVQAQAAEQGAVLTPEVLASPEFAASVDQVATQLQAQQAEQVALNQGFQTAFNNRQQTQQAQQAEQVALDQGFQTAFNNRQQTQQAQQLAQDFNNSFTRREQAPERLAAAEARVNAEVSQLNDQAGIAQRFQNSFSTRQAADQEALVSRQARLGLGLDESVARTSLPGPATLQPPGFQSAPAATSRAQEFNEAVIGRRGDQGPVQPPAPPASVDSVPQTSALGLGQQLNAEVQNAQPFDARAQALQSLAPSPQLPPRILSDDAFIVPQEEAAPPAPPPNTLQSRVQQAQSLPAPPVVPAAPPTAPPAAIPDNVVPFQPAPPVTPGGLPFAGDSSQTNLSSVQSATVPAVDGPEAPPVQPPAVGTPPESAAAAGPTALPTAPVRPVAPAQSEAVQPAPAIRSDATINSPDQATGRSTETDLLVALSEGNILRGNRIARELYERGEITIGELIDAGDSYLENPAQLQRYQARVEQLAATADPVARVSTPEAVEAERAALVQEFGRLQEAGDFQAADAIRPQISALAQRGRELAGETDAEQLNPDLNDEGDPELGESLAAASRQSPDATLAAAPRDVSTLSDENLPSGSSDLGRTNSFQNRFRFAARPNPEAFRSEYTASDTERQPRTLTREQVIARAKKIAPAFNFQVVTEPELTPAFQFKLVQDTGQRFDSDVIGLIHGNTVYFNLDRVKTRDDVDFVMAHEILGHAGLRSAYGPKLRPLLHEVVSSYGGLEGLLQQADRMGLNTRRDYASLIARAAQTDVLNNDHAIIAEEVIVNLVDRQGMDARRANILQRMGAQVRTWLRRTFPRIAKVLNAEVYADWELAVLAGEASYAGRQILDGAQPPNAVRVLAARRIPFTDRVREGSQERLDEAQDFYRQLVNGETPISERARGLGDNVRRTLRNVARNDENFYNRTVKKLTNHLRPLQLRTREIRAALVSDTSLGAAVGAVDTAASEVASNLSFTKRDTDQTKETKGIIATRFFEGLLGDGDLETRREEMRDRTALYERIQLEKPNAEREFVQGTQVLMGRLRESLSVLAQAMPDRRATQRDAFTLADDHRRILHGMERNDAFFFDHVKNKKLKSLLNKGAIEQLVQTRARTRSRGSDALSPDQAFDLERTIILSNAKEGVDLELERNSIATTGPESTNLKLAQDLQDLNLSTQEQNALNAYHQVMQEFIDLDLRVRSEWNGYGRDFTDAIQRYRFKYYSPQWVEGEGKTNDFDIGHGVVDPMMSTSGVAFGTQRQTVSPSAAILTMVNRSYSDRADNKIKHDVALLWATAQTAEGAALVGSDWGEASLEVVDKRSQKYIRTRSTLRPNEFEINITENSAAFEAALGQGRQEYNAALSENPGNYILVLKYGKKSPIPKLVKGERERSRLVETLKNSDSILASVLTGGASTMGRFHTSYDPAFPAINLVRETLASLATVGAQTGFQGARIFTTESMGASLKISPKISQFLFYQESPGAEAAAKFAALSADPEMQDFLDFFNAGGSTQFARSMTLDSRVTEMADSLRARGLTPDEAGNLAQVNRAIQIPAAVTDLVSRYAAFRTYRKLGYSKQQAAAEARNIADFGQRGQSPIADLGAMSYMFFRSGMVGMTQIVDNLLDSPYNLEAAGVASAIGTALFAGAYLMSGEDDDGNNKFLAQGNSTTHFKMFIGDEVIQIPYAYNGFSAIGAAQIQALFGLTGNQSFVDAASNIVDIVINNVTPVSNNIPITNELGNVSLERIGQKVADLATPTLLSPMLGIAMGVNNFGAPITPGSGSLGDPGSAGDPYNSSGRQIGSAAEFLTRTLAEGLGLNLDVRYVHYLSSEMINGPTALLDSLFEWTRIAGGRDYDADWKRAALPFAGLIGSPYNSNREQYYRLWNQLGDIERSQRTLVRSGFTPEEARAQIQRSVGPEVFRQIQVFDQLNGEVQEISTQMKDLRLSSVLTSAERSNQYDILKRQHDALVSRIVRETEAVGG